MATPAREPRDRGVVGLAQRKNPYWRSVLGVDLFKAEFLAKRLLYKTFGLMLPKLKDQHDYWADRGRVYMDEVLANGILDREVFFQNLLIEELAKLDFESSFEAGCGFGWNIRRVKEDFPHVFSAGLDFSFPQLANVAEYGKGFKLPVANADICRIPFCENAFDVGYSVGVFMNIHPDRIGSAIDEMIRVCGKYVIHLEYDEDHTTPELYETRRFKTNIVSHDYLHLYEERGKRVKRFMTHNDFGGEFENFSATVKSGVNRWEGFEGPGKYVLVVVEV